MSALCCAEILRWCLYGALLPDQVRSIGRSEPRGRRDPTVLDRLCECCIITFVLIRIGF